MHIFKLKRLAFALCLVTLPYSALAAGLGKLNIMSSLGEPLKADIELLSVTPEELSSISAAIASNESYENQGIEKPASHSDIKIEVAKNSRGVPILKLNSTQPITDAFLDMLIQVDWSSGRLLREYTLLLDPPGYSGEAAMTGGTTTAVLPKAAVAVKEKVVEAPQSMNTVSSEVKQQDTKKLESIEPQAASEQPLEPLPPAYDESQAYTTARGDTLSKIAKDLKPDNVSLEQMLVGLFQANPDAFDADNMNRLKVGQIIRAPSQDALQTITQKSAKKEVRIQSENWNAYKNKLAGIVEDSLPAEDSGATQSSSGKVMTAEDKAMPSTQEPRNVVKLSATQAAEKDKALQDKLTSLQEESIAKENALKEAQARSGELERQLEDMKKLLALKNDAMAKIQSDANEKAQNEVTQSPEQAANEEKPASETIAEETQVTKAQEPVKPAPAPKPAASTPPPAPVEQPSFLTSFLEGADTYTLGIAGGLVVLLSGGWLYLRNKRRKNLASFEEGIMTSGGLKANTVFGNTAGGTVDTGDTSFLTDFSQSTAGGMIDSHDVDPIAEAEVYMAYGRDAQAEEILKDAIVKEPTRYELHLKLLEIYQESNNTSAFEAISGELYTTLGATDPVWAKVAQLGIKMDPDNPLYQVSESDLEDIEASSSDSTDQVEGLEATIDPMITDDELPVDMGDDLMGGNDFAPDDDTPADEDFNAQTIPAVSQEPESEFDMDFGTLEFDMDAETNTAAPPSSVAETTNDVAESLSLDQENDTLADADSSMTFKSEIDTVTDNDASDALETMSLDSEENKPFDVPTLSFPDSDDLSEESENLPSLDPALSAESSIELEEPSDNVFPDTLSAENIVDNANTIDFNLDEALPEIEAAEDVGMDFTEASSIDFSDINLDMEESLDANGSTDEAADEPLVENSEPEPEEVETKLDLVMAYLDMEDKIGAKELLDEVMKEGGENQRKRATELLEKIS